MDTIFGLSGWGVSAELLPLVWKACLLTLVATAVLVLTRRLSAATRHWLLVVFGVSLLSLPLTAILAPEYPIRLPAALRPVAEGGVVDSALVALPMETNQEPSPPAGVSRSWTEIETVLWDPIRSLVMPAMLLVWLVCSLLLLARIPVGYLRARRRLHSARRLVTPVWKDRVERLARRLHVRRSVGLLVSDRTDMPFTFGILHPVIVLPPDAPEWSESHLQVVLLHELAHIRRLDLASRLISSVVVALYWFNPLVWWHDQVLRRESERACDDEVLRFGTLPSKYARHLVVLARSIGLREGGDQYALGFGQSPLELRIRSILDPYQARRMPVAQRWAAVATASVVLIALSCFSFSWSPANEPAVSITIQEAPPPPPQPSEPPPAPPPRPAPAPAPPPDHPVPPAPAPPAEPAPPAPPPAPPAPFRQEGGRTEMRWEDGAVHWRFNSRGVHWTEDGSQVQSIDEGGYLEIQESGAGVARRLRYEADSSGGIRKSYWSDGIEGDPESIEAREMFDAVVTALRRHHAEQAARRAEELQERAALQQQRIEETAQRMESLQLDRVRRLQEELRRRQEARKREQD